MLGKGPVLNRLFSNTPDVSRTRNLRFRRPTLENSNDCKGKDLQQAESSAYKPAYKENPKTAPNQPENLPADLAEIVEIWPELPEYIKAAIKALIETSKSETKRE